MKKREIMAVRPEGSFRRRVRRDRRQGGPLRIDLRAGKGPLNSLGHHPVAGVEPGFDDPKLAFSTSGFHGFVLDDIVRADHENIAAFLVRPDRIVSGQQCLVLMPDRDPNPHEKARQQQVILVVEDGARHQRASRRVQLWRGIVEMSLVRIALLILQPNLDRDARDPRKVR
jgi:hypothetical protein